MTKALVLVLAMAAPAFAVCQSVYFPDEVLCGGHPMIQTQCWPPALTNYGELFDGWNRRGDHVKLTCGAYFNGYTHVSCANLNEAAATVEANCCGTTANQIAVNCPNGTSFITYP